jgi:hypothetical protein
LLISFALSQLLAQSHRNSLLRVTALSSLFLGRSIFAFAHTTPGIHQRAEIRSGQKRKDSETGGEGNIMNLSVETKVAIAVATSFVVLMVGAMAQG